MKNVNDNDRREVERKVKEMCGVQYDKRDKTKVLLCVMVLQSFDFNFKIFVYGILSDTQNLCSK